MILINGYKNGRSVFFSVGIGSFFAPTCCPLDGFLMLLDT